MSLDISNYQTWIMLLLGLGVIWLVVSVVLKLAKVVVSVGCSLLILVAGIVILSNLLK